MLRIVPLLTQWFLHKFARIQCSAAYVKLNPCFFRKMARIHSCLILVPPSPPNYPFEQFPMQFSAGNQYNKAFQIKRLSGKYLRKDP